MIGQAPASDEFVAPPVQDELLLDAELAAPPVPSNLRSALALETMTEHAPEATAAVAAHPTSVTRDLIEEPM